MKRRVDEVIFWANVAGLFHGAYMLAEGRGDPHRLVVWMAFHLTLAASVYVLFLRRRD